jgi:hypothetical protein
LTRWPRWSASGTPSIYEGQAAIELQQLADVLERGQLPGRDGKE